MNVVVVAAVLSATVVDDARACECGGSEILRVRPNGGDLPSNGALIVQVGLLGDTVDVDAEFVIDGVAMAEGLASTARFLAPHGMVAVLRPNAPWAPGPHEGEVRLILDGQRVDSRTISFIASEALADATPAPTVSLADSGAYVADAPCGEARAFFQRFTPARDLQLLAVFGGAVPPGNLGGVVDDTDITIGTTECTTEEGFGFGFATPVRFGHVGVDGTVRFSNDVVELVIPTDRDGDGRADTEDPCLTEPGPVAIHHSTGEPIGGCPEGEGEGEGEGDAPSCAMSTPIPIVLPLAAVLIRQRRRRPVRPAAP